MFPMLLFGLVLLCRFFNFDLYMIALLSFLFINGAWVPQITLDFVGACLTTTFLNIFLKDIQAASLSFISIHV